MSSRDAELDAEGVTLKGDVRYDVPRGWRLSLRPGSDVDDKAGWWYDNHGRDHNRWISISQGQRLNTRRVNCGRPDCTVRRTIALFCS